MLVSIILFILVFSLVALAHELGHFWAARYFGVAVDEFGIGLPPRLWQKEGRDLKISIGSIPIGGYVRLRSSEGRKRLDPKSLEVQTPFVKMVVSLAGVFMNLVLAFVIFFFGFLVGMPPLASSIQELPTARAETEKVVVMGIRQGSPADRAGIKVGDYILKIGEETVLTPEKISEITAGSAGALLRILVEREGEELTIETRPELLEGRGSLGVMIDSSISKAHYAWWATPYLALVETARTTTAVGKGFVGLFAKLFTKGELAPELTGPVGIARIAGEMASLGIFRFLQFIALLTINLALINIIPLPALDGGRFVFASLEAISRRRFRAEVENLIHLAGFLLIIVLVVFITYRDVLRFFQ